MLLSHGVIQTLFYFIKSEENMSSYSSCPILHDLGQYLPPRYIHLAGDRMWEIPVPVNDVLWTIVLAYCCSAPSDFILSKRLTSFGAQKVGKRIKNSIKYYNPFFHRNTCFRNQTLIQSVDKFRKRVERKCGEQVKNFQSVIRVASDMLSCNIILMSDDWKKNRGNIEVCPKNNTQRYSDVIFIFSKMLNDKKSDGNEVYFSFGMPKQCGLRKQKLALKCILKDADLKSDDINKIIYQVLDAPNANFPLLVLKNSLNDCLSKVYKSQCIIANLQNAGLKTDPQVEDEDSKSALFYSMLIEDTGQLYILHEYAANDCTLESKSIRTPNPKIIRNLKKLRNHLEQLSTKIDSYCNLTDEIRKMSLKRLQELCQFNQFLITVCENILEVNSKFKNNMQSITDSNTVTDGSDEDKWKLKFNDAEYRKNIILSILSSYGDFFNGITIKDFVNDGLSEYLKYEDYFNQLDFFAALYFFDNMFLLKERMTLPDQKYSQIESTFHSFLYNKFYFERFPTKNPKSRLLCKMIVFQMRVFLQKELKSFEECLMKEKITKNNVVEWLPRSEVATLVNSPEIHGAFVVYKIRRYLNAAIEVKVKDIKSVLIIERCLHVLGESLNNNEVSLRSARKVLRFALPDKFVECLTKFRNKITHSDKSSRFRILAENDVELFVRIQEELVILKELLQPIFCAQVSCLERHYREIVLDAVREMEIMEPKKKDILQIIDFLSLPIDEENSNLISEFKITWKTYIREFYESLNQSVHVCNDQDMKVYSKYDIYNFLFLNIFKNAKAQIEKFEFDKNTRKNRNSKSENQIRESVNRREWVAKVEDYFWCCEYLLQHILDNELSRDLKKEFLILLHQRKSFFIDLCSSEHSKRSEQ